MTDQKFCCGWNQPGYTPEMVEGDFGWTEARDMLLWEVQRSDEGAWGATEDQLNSAASTLECAVEGKEIEIPCGTWVLFVLKA